MTQLSFMHFIVFKFFYSFEFFNFVEFFWISLKYFEFKLNYFEFLWRLFNSFEFFWNLWMFCMNINSLNYLKFIRHNLVYEFYRYLLDICGIYLQDENSYIARISIRYPGMIFGCLWDIWYIFFVEQLNTSVS